MTEQNKKDIQIAIGYLKLFAVMNGIDIKCPKTRFWSERYQITLRHTDMTEKQRSLLLENIKRLEEMIGES